MKIAMKIAQKASVLGTIAGLVAWPSFANAQEAVVVTSPAPTSSTAETRREVTGPNIGLITTGLVVFGGTYGSSVIVGATSDHQGDSHLYVPIAGPWMDLADRGSCGAGERTSCDTETTYKVLLVLDGIFQGVGALTVISGFLHPQTKTVTETRTAKAAPTLRLTPAHYSHGYGLAAVGTF